MWQLPASADLDFLLAQGKTWVLREDGSRQELGDAELFDDNSLYWVAGEARPGGLHRIAEVPSGRAKLDPCGRWLGIRRPGPELHLFDTANACAPGFRFHAAGIDQPVAIHPEGHLIACRESDEICLYGPDGYRVASATYPRVAEWWADEALEFSTCGEYLWLLHVRSGEPDVLCLLRVPSLEVADTCPPSWDQNHPYDAEGEWRELLVTTNPVTGHLAVRRQAGDDFLTLHFYQARDVKIVQAGQKLLATDDVIAGETMQEPIFSSDGKRFLLRDGDGWLNELSFPNCQLLARRQEMEVLREQTPFPDVTSYAYCAGGKFVLASAGEELLVFRSGDLRPSLLPPRFVGEVLPNGLVLANGDDPRELAEFRLEGKGFPVVGLLETATKRILAVYRRLRRKWLPVEGLGWVGLHHGLGW